MEETKKKTIRKPKEESIEDSKEIKEIKKQLEDTKFQTPISIRAITDCEMLHECEYRHEKINGDTERVTRDAFEHLITTHVNNVTSAIVSCNAKVRAVREHAEKGETLLKELSEKEMKELRDCYGYVSGLWEEARGKTEKKVKLLNQQLERKAKTFPEKVLNLVSIVQNCQATSNTIRKERKNIEAMCSEQFQTICDSL